MTNILNVPRFDTAQIHLTEKRIDARRVGKHAPLPRAIDRYVR